MIACSHPIRLRGSQDRIDGVTGELLARIVTAREPGGVMLVSCGDRRAGHCPSCAETYRYDAFHLVASGLRGGKGIPETVAAHPAVMVTFTAPSFGSVHTIRDRDGLCACGARHAEDDEALGTPVDSNSYRYLEQVIWNHLAPMLWKLTVQAVRRHLARELGVGRHRLGDIVHVRFVKVAEFQRRGVVHYHAVIRLDGPTETVTEPPSRRTAALLERAVRAAAREVRVHAPESAGFRWDEDPFGGDASWKSSVSASTTSTRRLGTSPNTRQRPPRPPPEGWSSLESARCTTSPRSMFRRTRSVSSRRRGGSGRSAASPAHAAGPISSATAATR
jgi:hypothetical protein